MEQWSFPLNAPWPLPNDLDANTTSGEDATAEDEDGHSDSAASEHSDMLAENDDDFSEDSDVELVVGFAFALGFDLPDNQLGLDTDDWNYTQGPDSLDAALDYVDSDSNDSLDVNYGDSDPDEVVSGSNCEGRDTQAVAIDLDASESETIDLASEPETIFDEDSLDAD